MNPKDRLLHSISLSDTWRIAAGMAREIGAVGVIALHGEMGAGKTAFVQGMAEALGIDRPVTSPTFAIVNVYDGPNGELVHMDLHRLRDPNELIDIGFFEWLEGRRILAIEWPEIAEDMLPPETIHITMAVADDPEARDIRILSRQAAKIAKESLIRVDR